MASSIDDKIRKIIASILEIELQQVQPAMHFVNDLGANSLDIVELIMALEEHLDIEIPDEMAEEVETVGDVIEYAAGLSGKTFARASQETPRALIAIGSDHAGFNLKEALKSELHLLGLTLRDMGPCDAAPVDYPDFAIKVAEAVREGQCQIGILICGTGIGMAITANKVPGVRAALLHTEHEARLARMHNDANVVCFGARIIGSEQARACLKAFLNAEYDPGDDGRHQRRLDRVAELESNH